MGTPDRRGGPLRLLWLIDSLTLGGAEALTAVFARAVDPGRLALTVCALKSLGGNPFAAELAAAGTPAVELGSRGLSDLGAFRRLLALVRATRPDVIHAHLTDATIWGAAAARLAGRPCVATLHVAPPGPPGPRRPLHRLALARGCARVLAVSEAARREWLAAGGRPRLRPERVAVVPNGVEPERWTAPPEEGRTARRELGVPEGAPLAVTVAALRPGKGLRDLLAAVPAVLERVPAARFLVVGDGPLAGELAAAARGLGGRVLLAGFRRDPPALLAAADLFVLPSRDDALPTALLEAMAAGLPVVAGDAGGIPEIVAPGTGRLVPPGDPRALAAAVAELLASPSERAALAAAGRARVRRRFTASAWCERLLDLYGELALNPAARSSESARPAPAAGAEGRPAERPLRSRP